MTIVIENTNGTSNLVKIDRKKKAISVVPVDTNLDVTPERFAVLTNEVVQLNREVAINGYKMGAKLRELHDSVLYKHGAFSSFDDFLKSISISPKWAKKLIEISKEYTEADFLSIGVKKLTIIVEATPEQRPQLLEQARAGTSRRELERQITNANKLKADEIRANGGTPDTQLGAGRTAVPAAVGSKRVTLVAREGLFGYELVDQKSEQAATVESLAKGACFTTVTFENGATGLFIVYLDAKTGTLKTKVTFDRRA